MAVELGMTGETTINIAKLTKVINAFRERHAKRNDEEYEPVNSTGTFLDRFAEFLLDEGYTSELLAPTSHNTNGMARFAVGYASDHFTTIDTLDFDGNIIWDSYNLKTYSKIDYLEKYRFNYIYDFLDYSFWKN